MSLYSELRRRNVLRVAAAYLVVGWLLTEVLTTVLPDLGAPGWAPALVIRVFAFGFIPVVILSWIYEITPEGIRKDTGSQEDNVHTKRRIQALDYVTIGGVLAAIILAAGYSARDAGDVETDPSAISQASVAVLPFVNMSGDKDNDYFSDGLTETLLHMLAQIPDLKVAARTSSFAFKGKDMDVIEIAGALRVAHVLEGSVQHAGNRVRITAQLIRADDGFHVWSENYDRPIDDIFALQDEIATQVGGSLSASLLGGGSDPDLAGAGTENTDAYDLYLLALSSRATFSYGGLQEAEELLKAALTIDPAYLDAKTVLAEVYLHQFETGLMSFDDAVSSALAMTSQVLEVRPDDPAAQAIQLYAEGARHATDSDSTAIFDSVDQLEALVSENPDILQARVLLTRLLQSLQQHDRALRLQLDALEQDPYNARIHYEVGSLYLELRKLDLARDAIERSLEIEPNQPNAHLKLARISLQSGDGLEYLRRLLQAMVADPRDHELPGIIGTYLYKLELVDEGDDFRERVLAIAPTSEIAYRLDLLRAIAGDDEASALSAARRAIDDDIEERLFAYGGAVQYLLRSGLHTGTAEEEFNRIEARAPGIFDVDAEVSSPKFRAAQMVAFDAWYELLPREEMLRRMDRLLSIAALFGLDPLDDPRTRVAVSAFRGDVEEAVNVALADVFTQPVVLNLGWQTDYAQPQYAEFVTRPEVSAAMDSWQADEDRLRERIRAFLADLSAES